MKTLQEIFCSNSCQNLEGQITPATHFRRPRGCELVSSCQLFKSESSRDRPTSTFCYHHYILTKLIIEFQALNNGISYPYGFAQTWYICILSCLFIKTNFFFYLLQEIEMHILLFYLLPFDDYQGFKIH